MTTTDQLSRILHTLDPAATPEQFDPRTGTRAQSMLAQTLAAPMQDVGTASSHPRRRRARLALLATTAAAAAVIVIAPTYLGGSGATAWSAVPTADKDAAATAESACATQVRSEQVPRELGPVDLGRMAPVLSDVRGPLVLVYLTDGQGELTCFFEDGNAGFSGSIANTDAREARAVPADSIAGSGGSVTATDLGLIRAVTGRVGTDVVSVILDTVAKGPVTATVVGGHFAAWWPDESITDESEDQAGPGDELNGITVTLSDGTVRSLPVAELLHQ